MTRCFIPQLIVATGRANIYLCTMNKKSLILSTLKFAVATGLIIWMIHSGLLDFRALSRLTSLRHLLALFLLAFMVIIINNRRWTVLLRAQDVEVNDQKTLPLSLIGLFFNYAVPGGVGGDVVKGYYLLQDFPQQKMAAASTVLLDRIMGMYGMAVMSTVALLLDLEHVAQVPELRMLGLSVLALAFAMTFFLALAFSGRMGKLFRIERLFAKVPGGAFLERVYLAFRQFRSNARAVIESFLLSLVSQVGMIMFMWFVISVTEPNDLSFLSYFIIVPLGLISTVLPIAPAGIGVGQMAFYILFKIYGSSDPQAGVSAITVYQLILLCWGLPGIYFYLTRRKAATEATVHTQVPSQP